MLDEYSIEQRATQIFDARSKEYFSEVLNRPGFRRQSGPPLRVAPLEFYRGQVAA